MEIKTKEISFCDKVASNIYSNDNKELILSSINNKYGIDVMKQKSAIILNHKILKNVEAHPHLIATKSSGTNYLLFLTNINDINYCFYIDRKIKQGYNYPRIISVKYRFEEIMFNDTLIEGEIIRDNKNEWHFLMSDLLIYKGELINSNVSTRFNLLFNLLSKNYIEDDVLEICPLKIKKLFSYDEWDELNEFIPKLNYECRGLYFYTLNSKCTNYLYLFPRNNNYFRKKIEKTKVSNTVFEVKKTDRPDIYNLFCTKEGVKINYGIACVSSIIVSSKLRKLLSDKESIKMFCEYSDKFKKWIPMKETEDDISDINHIMNILDTK